MLDTLINLDISPFKIISKWLKEAESTNMVDANAMALATVDENGLPNVRMVLMKGLDERGLVFYTNQNSQKGKEIAANPKAAVNFHWSNLRRCIRVRGDLEPVSEAEADAYFQSRSRGSRLASAASNQSSPIQSRDELLAQVKVLEDKYGADDESGEEVVRPKHWQGRRIVPTYIEFWQDGEFRLHDRIVFTRENKDAAWEIERLSP